MTTPPVPLVSVIVPADADRDAVDLSIRSCLAQSLPRTEVVLVRIRRDDDAGSVDTSTDRRLMTVSVPPGSSRAEQARAGIEAARGPFVLVLRPGDTLAPTAAMRLHRAATDARAQLVGFAEGEHGRRRSAAALPDAGPLHGSEILRALVPRDTRAELAVSRHLFRTELLRDAYAAVADRSGRILDDGAAVLLAYATAASYAAVRTVEVWRRSSTVDRPVDPEQLEHALARVAAFRLLEPIIMDLVQHSPDPGPVLDAYTAGRLTATGEALEIFAALEPALRPEGYAALRARVEDLDLVAAAAMFAPDAIPALVAHGERVELGHAPVHSVLLTTNVLTTGGVSGVLLTQARLLVAAGYRVTIVTHRPGSAESLVPEGATLVQLTGTSRRQRVMEWARLCRRFDVDVVIDHRILYSRDWPAFALAARSVGSPTIGWFHNFAGRPTYNGNDLQTLLQSTLRALAHLIVLSPLDVAFWKLRGIDHVSYLPNPPSPFLLAAGGRHSPRSAPRGRRLELVWWGRLEEHTKKVTELVEVAVALQRLGADFRLRIVGPDWADMSADRLRMLAATRGVAERVEFTGALHGTDLLAVIDSSDVFVNTSLIEGYPLTLPEAQARGLPIVMYDLPWLPLIQRNEGVIVTPQQDAAALAVALADLAGDPSRYEAMSVASLDAAARAASYDVAELYKRLLRGDLASEHSPEPTLEDGRRVLELLVFFAERSTPPPRQTAGRGRTSAATSSVRPGPRPRTLGDRLERTLTPVARRVIVSAPWLRPAAHTVKRALLRG